MSSCKFCLSPISLVFLNSLVSSANFNMLPVTPSSKSYMYTKNKIGPSTDPWGTPLKPWNPQTVRNGVKSKELNYSPVLPFRNDSDQSSLYWKRPDICVFCNCNNVFVIVTIWLQKAMCPLANIACDKYLVLLLYTMNWGSMCKPYNSPFLWAERLLRFLCCSLLMCLWWMYRSTTAGNPSKDLRVFTIGHSSILNRAASAHVLLKKSQMWYHYNKLWYKSHLMVKKWGQAIVCHNCIYHDCWETTRAVINST